MSKLKERTEFDRSRARDALARIEKQKQDKDALLARHFIRRVQLSLNMLEAIASVCPEQLYCCRNLVDAADDLFIMTVSFAEGLPDLQEIYEAQFQHAKKESDNDEKPD